MAKANPSEPTTAARWLLLAAAFVLGYAAALTASVWSEGHAWLRWGHWTAVIVWGLSVALFHTAVRQAAPRAPSYLPAIAYGLAGWGVLTVWALSPMFGLRQTLWLLLDTAAAALLLRAAHTWQAPDPRWVTRALAGGLLLLGLTIPWGTTPLGYGPRLWLGCCGLYFQPSEVYKLLLILSLGVWAAHPTHRNLAIATASTALAVAILGWQHDFGTAGFLVYLFIALYYAISGDRRPLLAALLILPLSAYAGYRWIPIVRLRAEAWLAPWQAQHTHGYQIIQGLLALHRGGLWGTGLQAPVLTPLAHSDFIFTAIGQMWGWLATASIIGLMAWLTHSAFRVANRLTGFGRAVALGIGLYYGGQSLLILGGNLRWLPLTGVAFPFLAYGGSALLSNLLALAFLLHLAQQAAEQPQTPAPNLQRAARHLETALGLGFLISLIAATYWTFLWRPPSG
ncbi:MAG: FtsW/RodA/SpoVE family cell cycle protein [Chloroflexi bacterium]|nr:FtsW/RodA/SpoVE family cell cycle protein [Chloroflexota bacterium]